MSVYGVRLTSISDVAKCWLCCAISIRDLEASRRGNEGVDKSFLKRTLLVH